MSYFYSHLVKMEPLLIKLETLDLSPDQRSHLTSLIDGVIHTHILEFVFTSLDYEDKQIFVQMLTDQVPKDEIFIFLNQRIDNAQNQLYHTIEQLIAEFTQDIKESYE